MTTSHSFDIDLATKYGVNEAILINHFLYWIRYNIKNKQNFHEGRTWSYQTLDQITSHFPYFTKEEVKGILIHLCTGITRRSEKKELNFEPVLVRANFNKSKFDKTTWYAFRDESAFNLNNVYDEENSPITKGVLLKQTRSTPTPIPYTIPYTETTNAIVCVDQPPVAASPPLKKEDSLIRFKKINESTELSKDQIFVVCVQQSKDWTAEEIDKLWEVILKYKSPINEWVAFCEGTIQNFRRLEGLKQATTGDKKCQTTQKKHKKSQDSDLKLSNKPSENTKENSSEIDIAAPALQKLRSFLTPLTSS